MTKRRTVLQSLVRSLSTDSPWTITRPRREQSGSFTSCSLGACRVNFLITHTSSILEAVEHRQILFKLSFRFSKWVIETEESQFLQLIKWVEGLSEHGYVYFVRVEKMLQVGSIGRRCWRTNRILLSRWSSERMHRRPVGSFPRWSHSDASNCRDSSLWTITLRQPRETALDLRRFSRLR